MTLSQSIIFYRHLLFDSSIRYGTFMLIFSNTKLFYYSFFVVSILFARLKQTSHFQSNEWIQRKWSFFDRIYMNIKLTKRNALRMVLRRRRLTGMAFRRMFPSCLPRFIFFLSINWRNICVAHALSRKLDRFKQCKAPIERFWCSMTWHNRIDATPQHQQPHCRAFFIKLKFNYFFSCVTLRLAVRLLFYYLYYMLVQTMKQNSGVCFPSSRAAAQHNWITTRSRFSYSFVMPRPSGVLFRNAEMSKWWRKQKIVVVMLMIMSWNVSVWSQHIFDYLRSLCESRSMMNQKLHKRRSGWRITNSTFLCWTNYVSRVQPAFVCWSEQ